MIHIHRLEDIVQVRDPVLKAGLRAEFKCLTDYSSYSIIIESLDELLILLPLEYGNLYPSKEPLGDYIEVIEPFGEGYCQIVCILNEGSFRVSLLISEKIATQDHLEALFETNFRGCCND